MNPCPCTRWLPLAIFFIVASPVTVPAQYMRIRDICRVKGQEENTLHGMGLVVGLRGTGDSDGPTLRSLARMMELMGKPVLPQTAGTGGSELKNARNVAMVYVTAAVPPEGARQGEQLRCTVNAISAKSLDGGYLLLTPLVGPRPGEPRVYAFAQGPLAMNQIGPTTNGVVHDGCRLEVDFHYSFIDSQNQVNLVIDSNHAGFPTADAIQQAINDKGESNSGRASWGVIAHATSPVNVRVTIPDAYNDSDEGRVKFIATLLDTPVAIQANDARVVVNERNGVIVVGEKVMVGRVAITHKNIALQTGNDPVHGPLHLVDPMADTSTTRLKALVDALNALKASPHDIIDIIKSLERSGDLYGRLIVE